MHLRKTNAQMAELVDALVSNTSGFTSMPVRSRLWVLKRVKQKCLTLFFYSCFCYKPNGTSVILKIA